MMENAKKSTSPNIVKLGIVLFAVTAIVSLCLGLVNDVTKDKIAAIAVEKTATAYANVLKADKYDEVDAASYTNDGTITKLSTGKDASGNVVGYVAETHLLRRAGHADRGRRP
jgi:Na+-translocating ferredoxin:NAD+ oxidoreductase RnfG subunit